MFIQTEATPNPATLKFLPGRVVLPEGTYDFRSSADAGASPLAEKLFQIPGVEAVFFGHDFITVTKNDTDWQHMKPAILGAIMEQFMSGQPVMASGGAEDTEDGEFFDDGDSETVTVIKDLLETRVRPAVAQDGGDITFKGFRDGIVYLSMRGACAGCPSSTATLQHGIQNLLRHFVPEVEEVRPI
ncbi:NifU family protein [Roseibium suaedae]|uniref:Fe-S cluster biogenesis protein NfuA, 4Fe-4S-binding domain n=1 Tax=Roseibium suaedae TaxID=735517 RepID=A0A1M6Z1K9_9HYPH|nr:NifU family protein [Roseibium suaedae]SHL24327.1 Fe-S cluster biogenesis protein NfuA, 4Fe-4S-binding domain [Roseibium suaedae]